MNPKTPRKPALPKPQKAPQRDYCAIDHVPLNTSEERTARLCAYHLATLVKQ